jgi:Domain of Unknown Function (DUF1080)
MRLSVIFLFLLSVFFVSAQDNTLTPQEKKQGWILLFDGKTSHGWRGAYKDSFPTKGWAIQDGMMIVNPAEGKESANGGDIVTDGVYGNFELQVDFKLTPGANSGIKYFVDPAQPAPGQPRSAYGLEFQCLDDDRHPDAKLGRDGNRTVGSLYDLIPASKDKKVMPIGEWNRARIVCDGKHVQHWLNGKKVLEYERGSDEFNRLIAISKYKNIPNFGLIPEGRILLQDHGNLVYFKNVKLRPLR